jgi:hypothetical protein
MEIRSHARLFSLCKELRIVSRSREQTRMFRILPIICLAARLVAVLLIILGPVCVPATLPRRIVARTEVFKEFNTAASIHGDDEQNLDKFIRS